MVDPQDLHWFGQPVALSRQGGYTLSFFVFWVLAMVSSALPALLAMPPSEVTRNGSGEAGDKSDPAQ